jgi:hypothetical protein
MIRFPDTLYTPLRTTDDYSTTAVLNILQFTVTHTLVFSVFTIVSWRWIYNSLTVISNHTRSLLSQPNSFLAIILRLSTQFLCSQPHILSGWCLKTQLNSVLLLPASELSFITTMHGPHRKHSLSVVGKMCLQRCCIAMEVACTFIAAGMHLLSCCLAMNVYSDFTIPAFGCHVTICWKEAQVLQIEPNTTYRKYKESAHMSPIAHPISQPSLDTSPIWTPVIAAEVKKNYNSIQCRLSGKIVFLCWYHTENLSLVIISILIVLCC